MVASDFGFCVLAIRIYAHRQNKTQRHIGLARPLSNLILKTNFNSGRSFDSPL